jgi:hypothetical protein
MKQELEAEYLATFKVGKNTSFYLLKITKYQNVKLIKYFFYFRKRLLSTRYSCLDWRPIPFSRATETFTFF